MRDNVAQALKTLKEKPDKGDPEKCMDVVVDLVHGEGRAAGKKGWPLWLFLGEDCISDVRKRAEKLLQTAEEWESAGVDLGFDNKATENGGAR